MNAPAFHFSMLAFSQTLMISRMATSCCWTSDFQSIRLEISKQGLESLNLVRCHYSGAIFSIS